MKARTPEQTEAAARTIAGQVIIATGAADGAAGAPGKPPAIPAERRIDQEIGEIEKLLGD